MKRACWTREAISIHLLLSIPKEALRLDWIKTINTRSLQPDLSVFIDVSPEKVLERLQRKKSVMETLDTQRKVREVYLKYVDNGELIRIDGDKEKRLVAEDLYRVVSGLLKDAKKFV